MMFFSKLRPTDAFGLVIFNSTGTCLIPVQKVSEISMENVANIVKSIHTSGGTTLISGFKKAQEQLNLFLANNYSFEQVKSPET